MVGKVVLGPFNYGKYLAGAEQVAYAPGMQDYIGIAANIGLTGYLISQYAFFGGVPILSELGMARPYIGSGLVQVGLGAADAMLVKGKSTSDSVA